MPEAENAVVLEHLADDLERAAACLAGGGGDLHLAFHELDWREEERGECTRCPAGHDQRAEWEFSPSLHRCLGAVLVESGQKHILRDPVAEEQRAGLDGCADERSGYAAVDATDAGVFEGFLKAVEGARVDWRVRLGL